MQVVNFLCFLGANYLSPSRVCRREMSKHKKQKQKTHPLHNNKLRSLAVVDNIFVVRGIRDRVLDRTHLHCNLHSALYLNTVLTQPLKSDQNSSSHVSRGLFGFD